MLDAKDYYIVHCLNNEPITETEWLLYMEYIMEEAERRKDDSSGE